MNIKHSQPPPSVNYHLWNQCNMRCRFCFAKFQNQEGIQSKKHLNKAESLELTKILATHFDKVSFVGGEPTLCPWLGDLIKQAKLMGSTTMLISNGSMLSDNYLKGLDGCLDWIALSLDSVHENINFDLGRSVGEEVYNASYYQNLSKRIKNNGIRLKINTVVNALNVDEDMSTLIRTISPERWKIFQVLPIEKQNNGNVEDLLITEKKFYEFVKRHQILKSYGILVIPETNEMMTGSYAMVDPVGRFFDNTMGSYHYSCPIIEVGIETSWNEISFSAIQFSRRKGYYNWKRV